MFRKKKSLKKMSLKKMAGGEATAGQRGAHHMNIAVSAIASATMTTIPT